MSGRDGMDLLVVGGGRMGTALGSVIASNDKRVTLWVRREELAREINEAHRNEGYLPGAELHPGLRATTDLGQLSQTPVVLVAIPSQSFRQVVRTVGDHVQGDQVVVHATKGFELDSFKRMSQLLREETCTQKVGVLSGPTIAAEALAGHPSGLLLASPFDEVIERVQALFEDCYIRVYGARDVIGTEVAGAFKNVIAVAAGAVTSIGYGDNTKWLLVTRGLNEMARLGVAMGSELLTFGGLAGVGDLAATCASPLSLSFQLGQRLASRDESVETILKSFPSTLEAVPTTAAVHRHASRLGLELPIVRAVYGLLHEGWAIARCLEMLMSIPVGRELAALRDH